MSYTRKTKCEPASINVRLSPEQRRKIAKIKSSFALGLQPSTSAIIRKAIEELCSKLEIS